MKLHVSRRLLIQTFICFGLLLSIHAVVPLRAVGYHLLKKFVLGGEGGWDLLAFDSAANRLYISRGTHVMVVDPDSGAIVGDIPNTPRVHGIAIAPEFGKGFTTNGGDATVTIFDLKNFEDAGPGQGRKKPGRDPFTILPANASSPSTAAAKTRLPSMRRAALLREPWRWVDVRSWALLMRRERSLSISKTRVR